MFESGFAERARDAADVETCKHATHLIRISADSVHSSDSYQALFRWLRAGRLPLTPLGLRQSKKSIDPKSGFVPAASMFLLAHYLQLSKLAEVTLTWVESNLMPEIVVFKLSKHLTGQPIEVKDNLVVFSGAHWNEFEKWAKE
ncbi:BQ2448_6645 [Microbotryum intermedium]|uniref:BQ2448_6645 protein n=1 Tax=Microbotryum intermedium TaxID=269621 RepID=A0A238FQD8_9BASI|nr:BQ2448_6645 [Microbotryum intermedium]